MENHYEILQSLIEKMEIVTVGSAVSKTKLNRKEIIDFVRSQHSLRIFDEENQKWINENVDGHC
ncbi:hypothetical protein [Lactococcus lactis]|uniref:Uncharacterized protein n=1 Tax=Lactococcus lactis TaxID=1358 RepID=A0A6M0MAM1_9LACT|nr:hypothetical protein [Lactococcus lactis]NEX50849.1 hypothetical protein [Lactococcus lactis]NEX56480.1 hypothetical protein [Lactococcus lactis]